MTVLDQMHPVVEEIELTPVTSKGELVVLDADGTIRDAGDTRSHARPFYARHFIFIVTVAIPMAFAISYLYLIAADRYASEARFVVRSVNDGSTNGTGVIASMLVNSGLSRSADETYAVNEYIASRDMVDLLIRDDHLREMMSRSGADFINRFPNFYSHDSKESLYRHYLRHVDVWIDGSTGISTLRMTAFRAADAHALASAILGHAEELINRLNERAYDDAERYANTIVDVARHHVDDVEAQLTAFRDKIGSVDPSRELAAALDMVGQMMTELAGLEAQLRQKMSVAPQNPGISPLRDAIQAYRTQIDEERRIIAGNDHSLAINLGEFERLSLQRLIAARELETAIVSLTKARQDARQQHLYLERIVEPNVSDEPNHLWRLLWTMAALAVCLAVFAIAKSLHSNIREHRA